MRRSIGTWMLGVVAGLGMCGIAAGQTEAPAAETKPIQAEPTEEHAEMPDTVYMLMKTSLGDIYLALNNEKAPISVENFLKYAEDGGYNGTVFHRVIPNFMIQGGGFDPDGTKRPTKAPIKNEWRNGLSNKKSTIAMARLGGRENSATNQFFINVGDNDFLDQPRDGAGYAVFGEIVKGLDIIEKIKLVPTTTKTVGGAPMGDWPVENVVINEVRRLTDQESDALVAELEGAASEG